MARTPIVFAASIICAMLLRAQTGTAIGFSVRMGDPASMAERARPRVAVDASGNVWIAGATAGSVPITPGAFQSVSRGGLCLDFPEIGVGHTCLDVFIQKRDSSGRLVYSTYLGGSSDDVATGMAVDSAGNLYLLGQTTSTDFPTTPDRLAFSARDSSAFLVKVSPAGALLFSTYLPPMGNFFAFAVDRGGKVYLTGDAYASSPNTNPGALPANGPGGVWVGKLNVAEKRFEYGVIFGGSDVNWINGIAVDPAGNAYITGYTLSKDFPVTEGAFQGGAGTGPYGRQFVSKIDPSGSRLLYSAVFGTLRDWAKAIAVDSEGNAYIAGSTRRTDFPVTPGAFQQAASAGDGGPFDAFVLKLNAIGSALVYSTYLGGSGLDEANSIAVDAKGNTYITGTTSSRDFPLKNPVQPGNRGFNDAFLVELNSTGSALLVSTYLGGIGDEVGSAVALGPGGEIYVGGTTRSGNFPTTLPPPALADAAFLAKLLPNTPSPPLRFASDVVSAATFRRSYDNMQDVTVAPGELIAILGNGIGPEVPMAAQLDPAGHLTKSLGETTVTFDSIPAPLLYVSASQVNAVVPYGVRGKTAATLRLRFAGFDSNPLEVKVAEAVPGLFAETPGSALAAALNEDGTINSGSYPAREGSIVALFGTGAGLLDPAPVDGEFSMAPYARVRFPVSVTVAGKEAEILYAGAAPGLVSGVVQINIRIPTGIRGFVSPLSQAVVLAIGGHQSAETVRIVVE